MAVNYISLGSRIRLFRKRRGLSQMALAEKIDCCANFISCVETGQKCVSLNTLVSIANEIQVSADELLVDSLDYSVKVSAHEFSRLLSDCTDYERKVIIDVVSATKDALRSNRAFIGKRSR